MKKLLHFLKENLDVIPAVLFPFLLIAAVFAEVRCTTMLVPSLLAGACVACFLLMMLPFTKKS